MLEKLIGQFYHAVGDKAKQLDRQRLEAARTEAELNTGARRPAELIGLVSGMERDAGF